MLCCVVSQGPPGFSENAHNSLRETVDVLHTSQVSQSREDLGKSVTSDVSESLRQDVGLVNSVSDVYNCRESVGSVRLDV